MMVPSLLNGRWQLTIPEHRAARPAWYTSRGWERRRLDAMADVISPGDVVVDVGAEEGDMSALCALFAGPTGAMILAEPNPKVWPNIRAIFEHPDNSSRLAPVLDWWVGFFSAEDVPHPPNDNVTDLSGMIDGWPECAYGDLIGDHGFRHLAQEADATPQVRLDTFTATLGATIDVVTMDVEGAEFEVLKGAYEVLANDKPTVFVSIHPPTLMDLYQTEPHEIHQWMASLGYTARYITTDHEEHWAFEHPERG